MFHFDLWKVRQLDYLRQELHNRQHSNHRSARIWSYSYLKSCSDHGLTCHDSRKDSNDQTGVEHSGWHRVEEGIGVSPLILADVCSLTDVLQNNSEIG